MTCPQRISSLLNVLLCIVGIATALLIPDHEFPLVDPATTEAAERLATNEDMVAIRAEFDRMLVAKGLVTDGQLT